MNLRLTLHLIGDKKSYIKLLDFSGFNKHPLVIKYRLFLKTHLDRQYLGGVITFKINNVINKPKTA